MKTTGFNFNNSYLKLPTQFYTRLQPHPVSAPKLVVINQALANDIDLDFSQLDQHTLATLFSGNRLAEGAEPIAQAYAGHQFGHFTMLGDGRAHLLGEHIAKDGQRWDIQTKGSGQTPYSRQGDGRATLGPMLREYIISEGMHGLGIASTRSLAVVSSGESVARETLLPGAILTRVASSHIRVGTFEYAATLQDRSLLTALLDYTIDRHFPEVQQAENKALAMLIEVIERQINLIVDWMRVGFIHGVMNTDNMALSGETIDYGPCAFMDNYYSQTVFSSIDHHGRYAYANQPVIAQWNIARLAETLLPLIDNDVKKAITKAEHVINQFATRYQQKWLTMMKAKLGMFGDDKDDEYLITELLDWMQATQADFTVTFSDLGQPQQPKQKNYQQKRFCDWYQRWQARLKINTPSLEQSLIQMKNNNPLIIPRNHQVEQALNAAINGDIKPTETLLAALAYPYQDRESLRSFQQPPEASQRVYQTFCGT